MNTFSKLGSWLNANASSGYPNNWFLWFGPAEVKVSSGTQRTYGLKPILKYGGSLNLLFNCTQTGIISGLLLNSPEKGPVMVSNFSFGTAGITLNTDSTVRTTLITDGSFASIKRRRSPGIIKGSPRRVATLGSSELRAGSFAIAFCVSRRHSFRYWTVKVWPESRTNSSILKLSFLTLRRMLLLFSPRSQTETLIKRWYIVQLNFVNVFKLHCNFLFIFIVNLFL